MRPVRRYLNWMGRQRPLLGLVVPPDADVEVWLEACTTAGAGCVVLPAAWRLPQLAEVVARAASRGLAGAICLPAERSDPRWRPDTLLPLARASRGLIAWLAAPPELASYEDVIVETLQPACAASGIPLAVSTEAVLAADGVALRAIGRTSELTGVHLDPPADVDPAALLAACLAARLHDRPALCHVRAEEGALLTAIGRLAFATGHALFVAEFVAGAPAPDEVAALATLARDLEVLPAEMPEPRLEPSAVLVLDPRGASTQPAEAVHGALRLLQLAAGQSARLFCADRPDAPAPRFLHVPAHGPLPPAAWSLCQHLARSGSHVLITGLSLEAPSAAERLRSLDVATATTLDSQPRPPWLQGRPLLSTGGKVIARRFPERGGCLLFLDRCIESFPREETSLRMLGGLVRGAGLVAEPFLASGPLTGWRRVLDCGHAALEADLDTGELGWSTR